MWWHHGGDGDEAEKTQYEQISSQLQCTRNVG